MADSFGKELTDSFLIQIFSLLLRDVETEVRIAAVVGIKPVLELVTIEKLHSIVIPNLTNL